MADFKAGDTVQLKSGGPIMTVTETEDGKVWVQWFSSDEEPKSGTYPPEALKKADPASWA